MTDLTQPGRQRRFPRPALTFAAAVLMAAGVVLAAGSLALYKSHDVAQAAAPVPAAVATVAVHGSVSLSGTRYQVDPSTADCAGVGEAGTVARGLPVWVYDGNGRQVAAGELASGRVNGAVCELRFDVRAPAGLRYFVSFAGGRIDSVQVVDPAQPVAVFVD